MTQARAQQRRKQDGVGRLDGSDESGSSGGSLSDGSDGLDDEEVVYGSQEDGLEPPGSVFSPLVLPLVLKKGGGTRHVCVLILVKGEG